MMGGRLREKRISYRGMDRRSTSDILPRWNDIRNIADIPKLYEISCHRRKM